MITTQQDDDIKSEEIIGEYRQHRIKVFKGVNNFRIYLLVVLYPYCRILRGTVKFEYK